MLKCLPSLNQKEINMAKSKAIVYIDEILPQELKAFVQRNKDVEDGKTILKDFVDTILQRWKETEKACEEWKQEIEDSYKHNK